MKSKRYKTAPGVILTSVCGCLYLVTAGSSMEINETAAFLWECLGKGTSYEELVESVRQAFETADVPAVEADVRDLLSVLAKRGLIVEDRS